ncbi:MAG: nucleotide exchange factor GrpE [Pseudomonadota bacterium]
MSGEKNNATEGSEHAEATKGSGFQQSEGQAHPGSEGLADTLAGVGATGEDPAVGEPAGEGQPDPADVIIALNEENTELKNKAMSLLADMENLRRRTEREVKDARQYAIANFARDMLSVSDNLTRALDAIPAEARAAADETLKTLLEGVQLTDRDLQQLLNKNGVQRLEPEGEKFDPNFHQAMFEVPNPQVANGTVIQVVQAGYKIGDRVLRPAMVGVAKGGPKVAPQPASSEAPENAGPGATVDKSV